MPLIKFESMRGLAQNGGRPDRGSVADGEAFLSYQTFPVEGSQRSALEGYGGDVVVIIARRGAPFLL